MRGGEGAGYPSDLKNDITYNQEGEGEFKKKEEKKKKEDCLS